MWSLHRECTSETRLVGKTVVITGADSGIGKETARDLYRRGAKVILACRDLDEANAAIEELKQAPPSKSQREQFKGGVGQLIVCKLDLLSFTSIRKCAKYLTTTEEKIHILVNNAAVITRRFDKTDDGFEYQLQTNYLGHFLFTLLLLPKLAGSTPDVKIINVSSIAHCFGGIYFEDLNLERRYCPAKAYAQSKLAITLFTRELARRLRESNIEEISVYSTDPGATDTQIARHWDTNFYRTLRYLFRKVAKPFIKTAEQGTQTTLFCALDEEAAKQTGLFYKNCALRTPSAKARNDDLARRLWNVSLEAVRLEPEDNFLSKRCETIKVSP